MWEPAGSSRSFRRIEHKRCGAMDHNDGRVCAAGAGWESSQSLWQEATEGTIIANRVTFVSLLRACAIVGALQQGKELQAHMRDKGLEADVFSGNSLVNMYAKCGSLEDARNIFDALPTRDVVAWNAMIAGYSEHGLCREALALYDSMQREGVVPASVVSICVPTSSMWQCRGSASREAAACTDSGKRA